MIDDVIPRKNLKSAIANTISLLRKNINNEKNIALNE